MGINRDEIVEIIKSNEVKNVICRAIELRPVELAKCMAALANTTGGYILIGVERNNGHAEVVGCQRTFDFKGVMTAAKAQVSAEMFAVYDFVNISGYNVFVIKVEQSDKKILLDEKYYIYDGNHICVKGLAPKDGPVTLFISYTECDTPIVNIIEQKIKEKLKDKVKISRYTDLEYKASFKAFMDTIQDHDFVLTVVSDTYLKRKACMYEVGEIIKDHHYKDKLLFIVLSEDERIYYGENAPDKIAADIYGGAKAQLQYTNFWKKELMELTDAIQNVNDYEATAEASKELQIIGQIYRKDLGEFMTFLADENGLSFKKMYEEEFDVIVQWLSRRSG